MKTKRKISQENLTINPKKTTETPQKPMPSLSPTAAFFFPFIFLSFQYKELDFKLNSIYIFIFSIFSCLESLQSLYFLGEAERFQISLSCPQVLFCFCLLQVLTILMVVFVGLLMTWHNKQQQKLNFSNKQQQKLNFSYERTVYT